MEAVTLLILAAFLLSGPMALRTQEDLAGKVIRLHVIAASDAPEDQAWKLVVRDAVLARAEVLLADCQDRDEAEARLRDALPELERLAASAVPDPVRAELRETPFPTKTYAGFALPAGTYLALRIEIGTGQGRNWWCVVFPPLCPAAGTAPADMEDTFTADEIRLITAEDPGYVLRFRTVELWERLRRAFS